MPFPTITWPASVDLPYTDIHAAINNSQFVETSLYSLGDYTLMQFASYGAASGYDSRTMPLIHNEALTQNTPVILSQLSAPDIFHVSNGPIQERNGGDSRHTAVSIADIDGNGHPDVVVASNIPQEQPNGTYKLMSIIWGSDGWSDHDLDQASHTEVCNIFSASYWGSIAVAAFVGPSGTYIASRSGGGIRLFWGPFTPCDTGQLTPAFSSITGFNAAIPPFNIRADLSGLIVKAYTSGWTQNTGQVVVIPNPFAYRDISSTSYASLPKFTINCGTATDRINCVQMLAVEEVAGATVMVVGGTDLDTDGNISAEGRYFYVIPDLAALLANATESAITLADWFAQDKLARFYHSPASDVNSYHAIRANIGANEGILAVTAGPDTTYFLKLAELPKSGVGFLTSVDGTNGTLVRNSLTGTSPGAVVPELPAAFTAAGFTTPYKSSGQSDNGKEVARFIGWQTLNDAATAASSASATPPPTNTPAESLSPTASRTNTATKSASYAPPSPTSTPAESLSLAASHTRTATKSVSAAPPSPTNTPAESLSLAASHTSTATKSVSDTPSSTKTVSPMPSLTTPPALALTTTDTPTKTSSHTAAPTFTPTSSFSASNTLSLFQPYYSASPSSSSDSNLLALAGPDSGSSSPLNESTLIGLAAAGGLLLFIAAIFFRRKAGKSNETIATGNARALPRLMMPTHDDIETPRSTAPTLAELPVTPLEKKYKTVELDLIAASSSRTGTTNQDSPKNTYRKKLPIATAAALPTSPKKPLKKSSKESEDKEASAASSSTPARTTYQGPDYSVLGRRNSNQGRPSGLPASRFSGCDRYRTTSFS